MTMSSEIWIAACGGAVGRTRPGSHKREGTRQRRSRLPPRQRLQWRPLWRRNRDQGQLHMHIMPLEIWDAAATRCPPNTFAKPLGGPPVPRLTALDAPGRGI